MSYPFTTFPLVNRVGVTNPYANVDARYGPWLSLTDALTSFNAGLRFRGLTVGIYEPNFNTSGSVVEYWYKDGVADGNLVLKQTGGGSVQPGDILPTVTNYLSTNNVLISSLEITDRFIVDNQLYYSTDAQVSQLSALSGNYDEGQFLGRVKLSQNNTRLVNVGETWTAKESIRNWYGVAMSSDGKYRSAVVYNGQIYISSDYGNTWTAKESSRQWNSIAMSSDGKYQTAVASNNQIFVSNDYGNTWVAKDSVRTWTGIAMSSDGKYQSATDYGGLIYISNDYGNTWAAKGLSRSWNFITMSSDGRYQSSTAVFNQIFTSNDYGNTWTAKESGRNWRGIAMSSDGKYQTAVVYTGQIYISSNYGNTWIPKDSVRSWYRVAMSSDGKYQIATGGQIYISSDYGNTWVAKESIRNWYGVAMSSDGKYLTVAVENGQIYVSAADELIDGNISVTQSISSTNLINTNSVNTNSVVSDYYNGLPIRFSSPINIVIGPGFGPKGETAPDLIVGGQGRNTIIGFNAGYPLTTGTENTLIGTDAGRYLVSGSKNLALGTFALLHNVNGSNNVGIGIEAGSLTLGNDNIFIGNKSNANSGTTPLSSYKNIIIGQGSNAGGFNDTIVIGSNIKATETGQILLSSINGVFETKSSTFNIGSQNRPNNLTVFGSISSSQTIYDATGNSQQWNLTHKIAAIDLAFKTAYTSYYHELEYDTVSSNLIAIQIYNNYSKTAHLFEKLLTYTTSSLLTGILITDKVNNSTLTKTLSYDGSDNLISITRVYT